LENQWSIAGMSNLSKSNNGPISLVTKIDENGQFRDHLSLKQMVIFHIYDIYGSLNYRIMIK